MDGSERIEFVFKNRIAMLRCSWYNTAQERSGFELADTRIKYDALKSKGWDGCRLGNHELF